MKPSDILARYYQEHGFPPLLTEEVILPEGMKIVIRSQRILGVEHEEAQEMESGSPEEVQNDR